MGWWTQNGANYDLRDVYGLKEAPPAPGETGYGYKTRTYLNVRDSDATIRLAWDSSTAGERCTYNALLRYKKPKFDVNWVEVDGWDWLLAAEKPEDLDQNLNLRFAFDASPEEVVNWLKLLMVHTLNVAGNSERTAPGIEAAAYQWLGGLFTLIKEAGI